MWDELIGGEARRGRRRFVAKRNISESSARFKALRARKDNKVIDSIPIHLGMLFANGSNKVVVAVRKNKKLKSFFLLLVW